MEEQLFVRKCDECGRLQAAREPRGEPTDSYCNAKCRRCRSPALEYGSYGWKRDTNGKIVPIEFPED